MMRKLLTLLFLTVSVLTYGQGIEFFHGTFDEAKAKAKAEKKQIFVDVYTSWCGPCKLMAKNVFSQKEVGDYYNAKFVCLKLDAEKESTHGFFKLYQASGYPSFFWLTANGELLDKQGGYTDVKAFIGYAQKAGSSDLNVLLQKGKERWTKGERSLELVNEYVLGVLAKVHPEEVKACLMDYFSTLSEEQLKSKENYNLLRRMMRNVEDNIACKALLKNTDYYYQNYEQGNRYWIDMYRFIVRSGTAFLIDSKPEEYKKYIALFKSMKSVHEEMYLKILEMEALFMAGNFEKGIPMAIALSEKYKEKHIYLAESFFYTLIIAHYFDKAPVVDAQVAQVIELADRALRAQPCKQNLLYLAAAYAKKGDYKKAYELMASEPFFKEPILSNALYKYMGLKAIHREYTK